MPGEGNSMLFRAARDPELARQCAHAASVEARAFGLGSMWTPCVDVNTNPRNPIIGTRAFSDPPELVADIAVAAVAGMQQARLLPQAKHFPGAW